MHASRDRNGLITITMTPVEFREEVEWRESSDPHDGATADWRKMYDRVVPVAPEGDRDEG